VVACPVVQRRKQPGIPQLAFGSGLDATEPVAATRAVAADRDTIEQPLAVQNLPDDQPAPIPLPVAAKRVRLPAKTEEPAIALAPGERAILSRDTLKRARQARRKVEAPVAVGQVQAEPASVRRTPSLPPRQAEAGHFIPAVDVPPSDLLVASAFEASPTPTEAAAEGRIEKPTPVDVLPPEVQPGPGAPQGDNTQGEPPGNVVAAPMAGLAPAEPAAALSLGKATGRSGTK